MAGAKHQGELIPESGVPAGTTVINDRSLLRTAPDFRIALVSGIVLLQYATDDRMAEAYAMVSLVEQGWADQSWGTLRAPGKVGASQWVTCASAVVRGKSHRRLDEPSGRWDRGLRPRVGNCPGEA